VQKMRGTTAPTNTTAALNSTASSKTIVLPKPDGAQDTIYLCNFRVSVDGEWLCLKELQDLDIKEGGGDGTNNDGGGGNTNDGPKVGRVCQKTGTLTPYGTSTTTRSASDTDANKCEQKMVERDWVNYYCRCYLFEIFFFYLFFSRIFKKINFSNKMIQRSERLVCGDVTIVLFVKNLEKLELRNYRFFGFDFVFVCSVCWKRHR
jgi:hypothetical protein